MKLRILTGLFCALVFLLASILTLPFAFILPLLSLFFPSLSRSIHRSLSAYFPPARTNLTGCKLLALLALIPATILSTSHVLLRLTPVVASEGNVGGPPRGDTRECFFRCCTKVEPERSAAVSCKQSSSPVVSDVVSLRPPALSVRLPSTAPASYLLCQCACCAILCMFVYAQFAHTAITSYFSKPDGAGFHHVSVIRGCMYADGVRACVCVRSCVHLFFSLAFLSAAPIDHPPAFDGVLFCIPLSIQPSRWSRQIFFCSISLVS